MGTIRLENAQHRTKVPAPTGLQQSVPAGFAGTTTAAQPLSSNMEEPIMPKYITIGYGDRAGYDRTPQDVRQAAMNTMHRSSSAAW